MIRIEGELDFISDNKGISLRSKSDGIHLSFRDWNTVAYFIHNSYLRRQIWKYRNQASDLDQTIHFSIAGRSVAQFKKGKFKGYSLGLVIKIIWERIKAIF